MLLRQSHGERGPVSYSLSVAHFPLEGDEDRFDLRFGRQFGRREKAQCSAMPTDPRCGLIKRVCNILILRDNILRHSRRMFRLCSAFAPDSKRLNGTRNAMGQWALGRPK